MVELYTLFTSLLKSQGVTEIKESTRTHFRRKLEGEFRDTLDFEDLSGNKRVFVIPRSLSRFYLAKQVMESCDCSSTISSTEEIWKTALHLRETIQSQEIKASWPPQPCELTENAVTIPDDLKEFLFTLLTGNTGFPGLQSCSEKVSRLITSFGQDLVYICCEWWTTKATKAHSTSIRRKISYEQCGTHSYLKVAEHSFAGGQR